MESKNTNDYFKNVTKRNGLNKFDWIFILIVVIFTSFSVIYSVYTPAFEESDGWFHWEYIRSILEGSDDIDYYTERSPPLYYLIQAGFLSFFDPEVYSDDISLRTKRNFYEDFNYFRHLAKDEFKYDESIWNRGCAGAYCTELPEKFPYQGLSLADHSLRFFSIACGIFTLYFTYQISKFIFTKNSWLSLFVVAFVAFTPQFIFINSVLAAEALTITFSTIAIFYLLKFSDHPKKTKLLVPLGFFFWSCSFF